MSLKRNLQQLLFPLGSTQKIRSGFLKGYRFVLSENSGWSPILGRWEPQIQKVFSTVIKPGNVIFDLGANSGIHSMLAGKLTEENGKVVAFEPLEENVTELTNNIQLNSIKNIVVEPLAISDKKGVITFKVGKHSKQGSIVGIGNDSGQEIQVNTISLDEYINEKQIIPDFIKIDVEGAESSVLSGFMNGMKNHKPTMIIEIHTKQQDLEVGKLLKDTEYSVYRIGEEKSLSLTKVRDFTVGYPDQNGIWGLILVISNEKLNLIQKYTR